MSFSLSMIFAAGLVSFASPCVLPLAPVYLATLAGGATGPGTSSRRVLGMAAAFAAGLSVVFVALGAFAATIGAVLEPIAPWLVGASALLMVVFGLRSLGLLRLGILDREARPLLQRVRTGGSVFAAFVFGAAFAIGWSPCIGPVLASLLTYAATHAGSPWESAGYLAVYAAGFSLPLLLLAALTTRARDVVRRLNRVLPVMERVTGVALIVLAAVLAWDRFGPPLAAPPAGAAVADGATCEAAGPGATCDMAIDRAAAADRVAPAREGRHVLEFVSSTCPACERMRPVIERVELACRFQDVPTIAVDVGTARGRALAARHGIRGTPTFVFVGESGEELTRLVGETDAGHFLDVLGSAFGLACRLGEPGGAGGATG